MKAPYKVEPLSKKHDRNSFNCGEESLDQFLKRFARQNSEKGLSRTFVAVKGDDPRIYGYYSLSSGSVGFETVPDNLPRYPVPVVHLGRLAVDISAQGERLGHALLFHAFERSAEIAERMGVYAIEVYALNENARSYYRRFDLTELNDDPLHLYITVKQIQKLISSGWPL